MNGLELWLDEHEVGWLKPVEAGAGARWSLAYLERWTSEALGFPLSPALALPARGGPGSELGDEAVRAFFERLLPTGEIRRRTFEALGLDADDAFVALGDGGRLGRDLAGAVRLIGDDRGRGPGPAHRPIPHAELSERIRHRDALPFLVWDGQVRGVLAGERDKLGVYVEADGGWFLVDGPQMASTHVLKPADDDRLFNEFFCMRLAARVGLDVAGVRLHRVPEPVLLVERVDRQRLDDGRVRRLHVIDGVQAGGGGSAGSGGDGSDAFAMLRHSPLPLVDARALLRAEMFRQLIGAPRGRAQDVLFFVDHGGLRVAPAHSFVGANAKGQGEALDADDWIAFARGGEIAPRGLALELRRLAEAVRAQAEPLAAELAADAVADGAGEGAVPRESIAPLLARVLAESDRQIALAGEIAK